METTTAAAAAATRRPRRTVRVHAAERSTDQEMLASYAEPMAAIVALVALVAAAWIAAAPGATADLPTRDGATQPATAGPQVYAVQRTAAATTDVVWVDPDSGTAATAVAVTQG